MEAIRAYLRALRIGRNICQDELGDAIGLSRQALNEWEKGRTYDLKGSALLGAVEYLQGKLADIGVLSHASADRGIELARERLTMPHALADHVDQRFTIEVSEFLEHGDIEEAIEVLQKLRDRQQKVSWFSFGRFLGRG